MASLISLIPIILQLLVLFASSMLSKSNNVSCNEKDRDSLLVFKQGILDPSNMLSSWSTEEDCCKWTGIQCESITGRVTKLNLGSNYLEGEINLFVLLELEFLKYLNLSDNQFQALSIPDYSQISHPHTNFSTIQYLDFSNNYHLRMDNLSWLSHVSSLKYLNLSFIDLQHETSWFQPIIMLPSLLELHLSGCLLDYTRPPLAWHVNSTSLEVLDLSYNRLNSKIFKHLSNFSNSLSYLSLEWNLLEDQLPDILSNFQNLRYLDVSDNQLNGSIPDWLCQCEHLKILDLSDNLFFGLIPPTLGNLSSLISLDLSLNRLNGSLPQSLWQLSNLEYLFVGENSLLEGVVAGENFSKLPNLKSLDLSSSKFIFHWDPNWIPPFQLRIIRFRHSNLGPMLPTWLYTQRSIKYLDISNCGISFIDHDKFWKMATTIRSTLDLSGNSIKGDISNVIINTPCIKLQNNNFSGGLPRISSNVTILIMHNNLFSGTISPLLCHGTNERNRLQVLNVSYNLLNGDLHDCWSSWKSLVYIDLESNNLTGKIPNSMGLLPKIQYLHLGNNRFFGEIPASLQNNNNLILLDLQRNNFSTTLPDRMGKNVAILKLRSNQFSGIIPSQICQLSSLIILDLADNKLSGSIPMCFSNISAMVSANVSSDSQFSIDNPFQYLVNALSVFVKGQEETFQNYLKLVHLVDLSNNHLYGTIPVELFHLNALEFLNLSRNQLIGKLPPEIGNMKNLESLDLSRNLLSGEIPQSMSNLTFLSVLNLSYNQFSGSIPLGTQLQSFEEYSYIGNAKLCGVPLKKSCAEEKMHDDLGTRQGNEDESQRKGFCMGMGVGFGTGFWAVCVSLFFKRSWRHSYFRFLNDITNRLMF